MGEIIVRIDEVFETPLTDKESETLNNKSRVDSAYKYLKDTSWYIERLNDPSSGKPVPQEVLDKRAEARVIINELEG